MFPQALVVSLPHIRGRDLQITLNHFIPMGMFTQGQGETGRVLNIDLWLVHAVRNMVG